MNLEEEGWFDEWIHRERLAPQYPTDSTQSTNQIWDAVLSFMNPNTIPFLNKIHFKYSFVKDNYPYENIYVYISR